MNKISNLPPKGTSDWFPDEFAIRKYIFDTWRKVCLSFGYEEYLTPIVESAEVFRAKSGEDIGGKELMTMTDRAGRELAIRPEMTPSVTRMVTRIYEQSVKPIRYFSIANFMRNEKPQRGRNREFWQLNCDIFGSDSMNSDVEILQIALEIMLSFQSPKDSFVLNINHRKLIEKIIVDIGGVNVNYLSSIARVLDKFEKVSIDEIKGMLGQITQEEGKTLDSRAIDVLIKFMQSKTIEELKINIPGIKDSPILEEAENMVKILTNLGYAEWIRFNPSIIRGFDYYDGMVFEVFDNHPDNKRSLFGGGRYNGLASIFGVNSFPATGFAPGDETTKLFLESWNLLGNIKEQNKESTYYLPIISDSKESNLYYELLNLGKKMRQDGKRIIQGLTFQKVGAALEFADKKKIDFVILFGEDEKKKGVYKIKNMNTGEEKNNNL